jgi:hypothetical protein
MTDTQQKILLAVRLSLTSLSLLLRKEELTWKVATSVFREGRLILSLFL